MAVIAGAQRDVYAVSDALLLDSVSASQGGAAGKRSGCASGQTAAASSSGVTAASKADHQVMLDIICFWLITPVCIAVSLDCNDVAPC